MKYNQWLGRIPKEIKNDSVWNLKVYRAALYLSDLCWSDTQQILDKRFFSLTDQLYRSVGSISANITEGYSSNSNEKKRVFMKLL